MFKQGVPHFNFLLGPTNHMAILELLFLPQTWGQWTVLIAGLISIPRAPMSSLSMVFGNVEISYAFFFTLGKNTHFLLVPWIISPFVTQDVFLCECPWSVSHGPMVLFPKLRWHSIQSNSEFCHLFLGFYGATEHPKPYRFSPLLPIFFTFLLSKDHYTFFFTFWEAPFQDSEPDNSLVTLAFNLIALNYCFYPGGHILKSIRILLGRRRDLSSYGLEILFENVQSFPKMSTNGMAFENDTVFSFWGATPLSNSSQAGTCSVNVFSTLI